MITDKFRFDLSLRYELKEGQSFSVISVKQHFYYVIITFCGEEGRGPLQSLIRACRVPPDIQTRSAKLKLRELSDPT